MGLRITTWNVNGIRNPFGYKPWSDKRTFDAMFDILEADIVIMQELKIQRKDLRDDMVLVPGWDCYFSLPKYKKGYSGVGIYTRQAVCAPIRAEEGLLGVLSPPDSSAHYRDLPADKRIGGYPTDEQIAELGVDPAMLDAEGRCVVLEFPAFVLFGVYSPANSNGLRDDFRYGFLSALDTRIRNLTAMGKRVVLTGDLNVSREEIDTASAEETIKREGMTHEEYVSTPNRRIFNQLLEGGAVVGERDEGREKPVLWDICRGFHEDRKGMFTHWEQKINARPGNFGSRIDYILCSIEMKSWFCESNIQEGLMGSDHCPVYAVTKQRVSVNGQEVDIRDIMNPEGMFKDGQRMREYGVKDTPAFSARLLPEFDKRRSIKDMFIRKTPLTTSNNSVNGTIQPAVPPSHSSTQTSSAAGLSFESSDTAQLSGSTSLTTKTPSTDVLQTSAPNPAAVPHKKRETPSTSIARPSKRSKPTSAPTSSAPPTKGQQSLKGFFKLQPTAPSTPPTSRPRPSTPSRPTVADADADNQSPDTAVTTPRPVSRPSPPQAQRTQLAAESPQTNASTTSSQTALDMSLDVIDPIVAKEGWDKLFAKPTAPRCDDHGEPCVCLMSKKKGINCGRSFWMCSRPLGPSGAKEKGTQWRCKTFIWASDWGSGS